jgi:hypothetical protein
MLRLHENINMLQPEGRDHIGTDEVTREGFSWREGGYIEESKVYSGIYRGYVMTNEGHRGIDGGYRYIRISKAYSWIDRGYIRTRLGYSRTDRGCIRSNKGYSWTDGGEVISGQSKGYTGINVCDN